MSTDTSKYVFNHTMLRVKDPQETIKFYELLGMKMIQKMPNPEANFDLYFMNYDDSDAHFTTKQGNLELTHNYGTENDPNFKINNGNSDPGKGFGHVCVSVDNIQAACKRLEDNGVKFQKRLTDGRMKHIAFALDPNGYWVEIIGQNDSKKTEDVKETDPSTYKFNHTMFRIKDAEKSLKFYQETMGMKVINTSENPDNKFNLYFLTWPTSDGPSSQALREGILELTWNYGTEKDPNFSYHDGNKEPQGFGHIAVSVDDLDAACDRFEKLGVNWQKRLTDGRMKNVAFVKDPDGYWIEVVQNAQHKSSNL